MSLDRNNTHTLNRLAHTSDDKDENAEFEELCFVHLLRIMSFDGCQSWNNLCFCCFWLYLCAIFICVRIFLAAFYMMLLSQVANIKQMKKVKFSNDCDFVWMISLKSFLVFYFVEQIKSDKRKFITTTNWRKFTKEW